MTTKSQQQARLGTEQIAAAVESSQVAIAAASFSGLVEREREYQRGKWGSNDNIHTWPEWAAILGEEYGEVCRALKDVHWQGAPLHAAGRHGLRGELVQLAAICAAMIERLDPGVSLPPVDGSGM